jgi:2-polyprenyl-3-methyl-5-hydroxy-6-metoxy-1,4-benzoquinol methylase
VPGAEDGSDSKVEELTEIIREIQQRVRARYPAGGAAGSGAAPADLMPLLHARDAAEAKVAAIGTVNPRRPGPLNAVIQAVKRVIARALDWHVREQVEFNRGVMDCVNASLEALNQINRTLAALAGEARELQDIRIHWEQWRQGWEQKLSANEVHYLRGLADLQAAFQQRVTELDGGFRYRLGQLEESNRRQVGQAESGFRGQLGQLEESYHRLLGEAESGFRALVERQHAEFTGALAQMGTDIQKRFWDDLEKIRTEYERLIHNELRTVRQRLAVAVQPASAVPVAQRALPIDPVRFTERFRGSEEYVKRSQQFYVERFRGCRNVLDIGCGRGEFLELMAAAGIPARGIDLSEEFAVLARSKGLAAGRADVFDFLPSLADQSLDGVFCAHVIEHLPPERLPELIQLCAAKLCRDGVLAVETPNPECLAVFATHFYVDPTHTRPAPASLLVFYLEEHGFGRIEVRPLAPAVESLPVLSELPDAFRSAFFGGLDYAILARRL